MFGLLRTHHCHASSQQKYQRRLHYCGACKTLGQLYGQHTRMLLNHDVVFLTELLSALSGQDVKIWAAAYQSYNCLARPQSEAEMPLVLQYAATANILLTEFKLEDQCKDSGRKRWQWLQKVLRSPFEQATQKLQQWGFPLDALWTLNDKQDHREAALQFGERFDSPTEALRFVADPTAQATAMFFEHGARLIGTPQLSSEMAQLGADFGVLIYVLDALEDYEQDAIANEFNAIRTSYQLTANKLIGAERKAVIEFLLQMQYRIVDGLFALPLQPTDTALFVERLRTNLARKLEIKLPIISCSPRSLSLRERWQNAITTRRRLMQQEMSSCGSLFWAKAPFVFITVLAVAFLLPSQSIKSWRECLELSVNLMVWGSIPVVILAMMQGGKLEDEQHKKNKSSCLDSCDCCECCCNCSCDGCCDGCSCCDCSCDC